MNTLHTVVGVIGHVLVVARGVLGAAETAPLSGRLILRLVGRRSEEGCQLLAPLGFATHEDLMEAIRAVAAAARQTA